MIVKIFFLGNCGVFNIETTTTAIIIIIIIIIIDDDNEQLLLSNQEKLKTFSGTLVFFMSASLEEKISIWLCTKFIECI